MSEWQRELMLPGEFAHQDLIREKVRELTEGQAEASRRLGGPVRISRTHLTGNNRLIITWERYPPNTNT